MCIRDRARKVDKRLRSLAVRAADVKGSAGDVDDWGERCYALALSLIHI